VSGWSVPIDALVARMKGRLDTVARQATRLLYRSVVLKSPVRTGRFVANWNVSYGTPDYSTTTSVDRGRGLREADTALHLPVGGIVYLSNGLPYSRRLEHGYSKQAPSGMVKVSVVQFDRYVREAVAA